MSNKERGEQVRRQILGDVQQHPGDITRHIAERFSISPQAVYRHIKRLEEEGRLSSTGTGKGKRYSLGDVRECSSLFQLTENFQESEVWREHFAFVVEGLPENVVDICHYGFTEMVNNVIDHSAGTSVFIAVVRNRRHVLIIVMDNGEGIFRRIKRLCNLTDERQALVELSKGKLTTDPDNHTGEGVFFTSRMFDEFEIESKGIVFSHDDDQDLDYVEDTGITKDEIGTVVSMSVSRKTDRDPQEIFDSYTAGPEDFQFNKTVIPVRLAQYGNEKLVSRSQAKRLLARVENFEHVVFDFKGVTMIGQAFADEIFRVYINRFPNIALVPVNMNENVSKMVARAQGEQSVTA
jgi:anti-sigma regulatory factor (Ser/Thr protein kinase)